MMKFPFEAHVVDAERGGTVRIAVDETGEVVLKDWGFFCPHCKKIVERGRPGDPEEKR